MQDQAHRNVVMCGWKNCPVTFCDTLEMNMHVQMKHMTFHIQMYAQPVQQVLPYEQAQSISHNFAVESKPPIQFDNNSAADLTSNSTDTITIQDEGTSEIMRDLMDGWDPIEISASSTNIDIVQVDDIIEDMISDAPTPAPIVPVTPVDVKGSIVKEKDLKKNDRNNGQVSEPRKRKRTFRGKSYEIILEKGKRCDLDDDSESLAGEKAKKAVKKYECSEWTKSMYNKVEVDGHVKYKCTWEACGGLFRQSTYCGTHFKRSHLGIKDGYNCNMTEAQFEQMRIYAEKSFALKKEELQNQGTD